jgi:3-hydroxyacyl-[acyl-carrier-protein] dehydratase
MPDQDLLSLLPHRAPFLWIDEIESVSPGLQCAAHKLIPPDLDVFAGHFPGDPVMPGVLLIEAAAQTAAVMMASRVDAAQRWAGGTPRMGAVNWFKFHAPVRPGALLAIETRLKLEVASLICVSARLTVEGALVAEGELTLTVAGR